MSIVQRHKGKSVKFRKRSRCSRTDVQGSVEGGAFVGWAGAAGARPAEAGGVFLRASEGAESRAQVKLAARPLALSPARRTPACWGRTCVPRCPSLQGADPGPQSSRDLHLSSGGAWPARVRDLLGQSRAQGASFPSWDTTLPGPLSLPGLPGPRPWPVWLGRRSAPHTWQLPERFQGGGLKDETL